MAKQNTYWLEDLANDRYVIYVVLQDAEGPLLKAFPTAQRITRARAVQLARTQGRAGDWCSDAASDMATARSLGGDLDIEEAVRATARAIEYQLEFLAQLEEFKPVIEYRAKTRQSQSAPAPAFARQPADSKKQ